jgi:hypothetical protein
MPGQKAKGGTGPAQRGRIRVFQGNELKHLLQAKDLDVLNVQNELVFAQNDLVSEHENPPGAAKNCEVLLK